MNPASLSGFVTTFFRILGSTVVGQHSAVLEGLEGGVSGFGSLDEDVPGEQMTDVEAYGALGLVVRPRPPEQIGDNVLAAEGIGIRTPAGLLPVARRDLRLNRRFPAPGVGTVALVGYGGGYLSFDDAEGGESTLVTLKVPYGAKSHTITVTPNGSLKLLHGDGGKIEMKVGGSLDLNGVIIDSSGNLTSPAEVRAMGPAGVKLSTHPHPTAMGPSGPPTPGV